MSEKLRKALVALADLLGADFNGGFLEIEYEQVPIAIKIYEGFEASHVNVLPRMAISTPLIGLSKFDFFEESVFDKVLKFLSLQSEYESGFPNFDQALLLFIEDKSFAQRFLADQVVRDELFTTFNAGVTRIFSNGEILATEVIPLGSYEPDIACIKQSMNCLGLLRTKIIEHTT